MQFPVRQHGAQLRNRDADQAKKRECIVQNALPQKIIIQQSTRTDHTVFWLFILAIYIVIVYNFYKDDYY